MEIEQSKSSEQININNNEKNNIKVQLAFKFEIKMNVTEKMTISELKTEISKNYFLTEDEYEIFIGENSINNEPNNINVMKLFEKYKSNNINIKTYKNILDLKDQLNNYENFLSKNISLKTKDIDLLSKEYENLKNDLSNL
jgi:hypothetical protein